MQRLSYIISTLTNNKVDRPRKQLTDTCYFLLLCYRQLQEEDVELHFEAVPLKAT